jgi:hypothetical protein
MFWAGVVFYNDGPAWLERTLLSAKASGVKTIAIDGAYKEFLVCDTTGTLKYYSTDGCLDVAKKLADICIESPAGGWPEQSDKRTRYFKAAPPGSFLFVLDADEVLRPCRLDAALLADDVYRVMLCPEQFSSVRLYRIYEDLEYLYQHCRIYHTRQHTAGQLETGMVAAAHTPLNGTRKILVDADGKQVWYDHYKEERPTWRKELKQKFYLNRRELKYGY